MAAHIGSHPTGASSVKRAQFVGEADLPRSTRCELLAANEAILKPAVQRGCRHTQLTGGFGHCDQLPIRWIGRWLVPWNVPVRTQASDGYRGEPLAACTPATLTIENAGDHGIRIMHGESA